ARQPDRAACGADRRPQAAGRDGARPARLGRDAPGGRPRRVAAGGGRNAADVAGIPAEMTMTINLHVPSRRELLLSSGVLFAWACMPKLALAEGRDPRLLVFILRGALDGLATVAPVGDPDWVRLRGNEGLSLQGTPAALPLNGFFALNPAMPNLHRMYKAGHATIVHAVASPYRDRSHFDGQDVLESGLTRPGAADSG